MRFGDGIAAARKTVKDTCVNQIPKRKLGFSINGKQSEMAFGARTAAAFPRFIERLKIKARQVIIRRPLSHGIVKQFR